MNREERIRAVVGAVRRLAGHPRPALLADGLSAPMARECLSMATAAITVEALRRAVEVPGLPPRTALVVAARGVFTAPLEWVCLLAAVGARITLKLPSRAPAFGQELARAFRAEGFEVQDTVEHRLPAAEAVVAMGGDDTMARIAREHAQARLSLHGHRFSVALVKGSGTAIADALARDVLLYDGRGCFTPAAVFTLTAPAEAGALAEALAEALAGANRKWPVGELDPGTGPEWRRRMGAARIRARHYGSIRSGGVGKWAVALQHPQHFEPVVLPRFITVHPLPSPEAFRELMARWGGHLAACGTDFDPVDLLLRAGFERICPPGEMQQPPLGRPHGGREALRPLMRFVSVERSGLPSPQSSRPARSS